MIRAGKHCGAQGKAGQAIARAACSHVRKVRAPQGRMLANGQAGRPDGKCRRKEDSRCPLYAGERKAETVV